MEKIAFQFARTIVVPSRGLGREITSAYGEELRSKLSVIPNPVDVAHYSRPADFSAGAIRDPLSIPPNVFLLSFCALGSFKRKGLDLVLQALSLERTASEHLLVIGGNQQEIGEYKTLATSFGVNARTHFVGLQNDIRSYLWSSDAFILPSAYEGLPLACLQAAAAGLPLIATKVNGIEDFLIDGVNGWLVDRTAESIAAAIRDAAASPEKTALLGQTAQNQVQAYRTEIFQSRWLQLLDQEFGIRPGSIPAITET
jgi:glycosyltransferase involved in cell wall biosynthesis